VITPTQYTADHNFSGAMRIVPDLTFVDLPRLRAWQTEFLH